VELMLATAVRWKSPFSSIKTAEDAVYFHSQRLFLETGRDPTTMMIAVLGDSNPAWSAKGLLIRDYHCPNRRISLISTPIPRSPAGPPRTCSRVAPRYCASYRRGRLRPSAADQGAAHHDRRLSS